jgi:hypothetical protein
LPGDNQDELIAARYERRSLLITANQPFGEWGELRVDDLRRFGFAGPVVRQTMTWPSIGSCTMPRSWR